MSIDPTREEWLEARKRMRKSAGIIVNLDESEVHRFTTAALGPCPPEPAPPRWHLGYLEVEHCPDSDRGVWVGFVDGKHHKLTPANADAMAAALIEHAAYAREQEAASDACGHLLEPAGRCLRPGGHIGLCRPHPLAGDDDA